jgi:hypothetical protein
VTVNGDLDPEENETFLLRLSNANDAAIEDSVGLGTIRNDDFIVPMIVGSLTGSGTVGAAFEFQVPTANTPTEYLLTGNVPVGMAINAETGLISWVPSASGVFEVGVEVSNPAGMDTGTLSVTVADNPLADAIEQGGTGRVLRTGPEPWLAVTDTTNDGVDAAVSGVIVDNSSSWIEMDVSGPAFVFFHWKVDSEEGFDLLTASVDGDVRKSISGNVDWHREVLELSSGSHTVRWSYQKDGSVGVGLDKGWLDEVIVSTDSPLPLILPDADVQACNEHRDHWAPCRADGGCIRADYRHRRPRRLQLWHHGHQSGGNGSSVRGSGDPSRPADRGQPRH